MAVDEERIVQIIPAVDWYATYQGDSPADPPDPVVCFALVEIKRNGETWQEVRSMVTGDRIIESADTASNFNGVIYRPNCQGSDA